MTQGTLHPMYQGPTPCSGLNMSRSCFPRRIPGNVFRNNSQENFRKCFMNIS
jgi:hypothetical protein